MSEGIRIPLADADRAAAYVFGRWQLDPEACQVVGSVRRRRDQVGDMELIAPAFGGVGYDVLFEVIAATMEGKRASPYHDRPVDVTLFSGKELPPPIPPAKAITGVNPIGREKQGLKPGFLHARLELRRRDGSYLPCEVYRYTPENRGWMSIMRTGPEGFGRAFLTYWKHTHGIAMGGKGDGGQPASIEGHLVDAAGAVVDVPTEEIAFQKCGAPWIAPEDRDEFGDNWRALKTGQLRRQP